MADTPQWQPALGEMLLGKVGEVKRKGWRGDEGSVGTTVSHGKTRLNSGRRLRQEQGLCRIMGVMGRRGSVGKGNLLKGE